MSAAANALGWAILHSIWQLSLVGAAAALLLRSAGKDRPRAQYGIAFAALVLCLVIPVWTFAHAFMQGAAAALPGLAPQAAMVEVAQETAPAPAAAPWLSRMASLVASHLGWITLAWGVGVGFMVTRMGGGLWAARRWRVASEAPPAAWENIFRELVRRLGIRGKVVLRASARITSPVAMGVLRPVVLVPAALFTSLPPAYLEALLAHELAHVARHDYTLNLIQALVEVFCFHHPVVWWLSRRVRIAREHLCDDRAAAAMGDPLKLARALDALDDAQPFLTHLALAAHGGPLFERIQRLVKPRPATGTGPWSMAPLAAVLAACATLVVRAAVPAEPPIASNPAIVAQVDALAAQAGLDPQLLRSVAWAESGLNPSAKSPKGALGLLQVMPATAQRFGATDTSDQAQVAAAGARYLKFLLERYDGDVAKAVTAYNCGEKALDAGEPGNEARTYSALVMDVFRARAVQPAPPLGQGWVDGTLRRNGDGATWTLTARLSHRGNLKLEFLPVDKDGKIGEKPYARLVTGSDGAPGDWTQSSPKIIMQVPAGADVLVRCTDAAGPRTGEVRLTLDTPWKTFAFQTTPKPES